jgi:hypothetical protein
MENDYGRRLVSAAARHEDLFTDGGSDVHLAIMDYLYGADQESVGAAVSALRAGARDMLGSTARGLDIFGPDGDAAVGDGWDVLQNYAQEAFFQLEAEHRNAAPEGPEPLPQRRYPGELIAASYDPAMRRALGDWADQNADLLPGGGGAAARTFASLASGDLDGYAREFAAAAPEADTLLSAGRLPFAPALIQRSPELARLAADIWRVTSTDSPARRELFEADGKFRDDTLAGEAPSAAPAGRPAAGAPESPSPGRRRGSQPQAQGARLEQGMLAIFRRLFRIEAGDWQVEGAAGRRAQIRRQRSGAQYGADIVIRFKGAAVGSSSTCLAECKNYVSNPAGLTVGTVAEKVLQAQAGFAAEPVDHWILISPDLDPGNELDRMVEHWNATQFFPFTIQIWSPQSGVRDLFATDPDIYRSLYGQDPPGAQRDAAHVFAEFSERLRPPVRLPGQLRRYIQDEESFVERSERGWLSQLASGIERFGFDDKGARLARPLEDEILSVLLDSPEGSNVALLLAEFGEGKSFFTVSLCARLRDRYLAAPGSSSPVPVRLRLRGYRYVSAAADFLRTQLELLGLSMTDWGELCRGNVLVILDGLDEMSVRQDPATTRENLDNIGSLLELLDGLPVLVTSRPHFFASSADRDRFYDRLRKPHVFRMRQPARRDTVAHLRAYADSLDLTQKLNRIKELYDPIGLAGKVLFLDMIKKALPDLPEDHFDELVLYETYVEGALSRKIELLRDPESAAADADLLSSLRELLEMIAVAIHVSGEGSVDLREFTASWGGAARFLWRASELDPSAGDNDADADARIGSRSLLRRAAPENEERWLVEFFHRSMKEYFVAKALRRALDSPDPYVTARALLLKVPVEPEIAGFFRLLANEDQEAAIVLGSLAHSARTGSGQGLVGSGAISLYHAAGGGLAGGDWRSLELDGALLAGADLSHSDFRGSSLRSADLSSADLTGVDLRSADLTGANLDAGGPVISLAADAYPRRFLCLTQECELGRIAVQSDGTLRYTAVRLPRSLRWPGNIYLLAEDTVLVTAHSEFMIADISEVPAREVAYFRVSSDIASAAVVGRQFLGIRVEPRPADSEALLIGIADGQLRWRVPVFAGARAYEWLTDGLIVQSDTLLLLIHADSRVTRATPHDTETGPPTAALCVRGEQAITISDSGQLAWFPLGDVAGSGAALAVHHCAGTAVTAANGDVLSAGSDGSVALAQRRPDGTPVVAARVERRIRCAGARIEGMKGNREHAVFASNGAE